jgi:hypothetical protein
MSKRPRTLVLFAGLFSLVATACNDVPVEPFEAAAAEQLATPATPSATPSTTTPSPKPVPLPQLPRGGRRLFPDHQLVAFVGAPGAPALGPLDSNLTERAQRLERLAASYRHGRIALPVMELIVVTAQGAPGRSP